MHDAKDQHLAVCHIVKDHIRKSSYWPVTNTKISNCSAFRIDKQLINGPSNTSDKVSSQRTLASIVPGGAIKDIRLNEGMISQ